VIFPYGNKASMVLPSERFARRRSLIEPPVVTVGSFEADSRPILTCFDAAGVGRETCSWDKDGRCVFCGRRRMSARRSA
jgi:hypothetical protein